MLRITEKDDFEDIRRDVEATVVNWRQTVARCSENLKQEFQSKLMISLIYHDFALEGTILDHSEIQAAIDTSIISDPSLIASYELINNFNTAVLLGQELAKQNAPINTELIKQLYSILNPKAKEESLKYRDGSPLHRQYYHKIVPPEEVEQGMKELDNWYRSEEFLKLETIEKACQAHWRLMAVFPWLGYTGRLARIISMVILKKEDYPLPVIHSISRQEYYESLRAPNMEALDKLYLEALKTTAASAIQVFNSAG